MEAEAFGMEKEDQKHSQKKKSVRIGSRLVTIILVVLVLAGFAATGYLLWQNNRLQSDPNSLQKAQTNQANALKDKVSKLISVPNETPIVATVSDKEKLKDQPFFADAQNGDYILMFPQAKKAYIYRESENKLINVGPIAITSDTAGTTTTTKK